MHQQGGTIEDALNSIAKHDYVLPAIQREFVWGPEKICNLFDSLMQGYPFGELMLWRIDAKNAGDYKWYDFVRNYHERDDPHCPELGSIYDRPLTAVLDGQQRLTAFNIGLRGSMAWKLPYRWWSNPHAFPKRVLSLNLLAGPEPDEEGNRYEFEFIDEPKIGLEEDRLWFKVADILTFKEGADIHDWVEDRDLRKEERKRAYRTLDLLYRRVRSDNTVAFYEEKSQDIERVLNIFIRCNRGGTPLSYSNLLLSIAVSQWKNLDARKEVYGLVDEMNRIHDGLRFNADFVLKAGLMLTDIASVGFQVRNFTYENMTILEDNWQDIKNALLETAQLVDTYGFDSRTLRAMNSLLPIAYYLYRKGSPTDFDTSDKYAGDRTIIRRWLTRSILKESGIWGSGLDTLLTALREVIRSSDCVEFPVLDLRRAMAQRGKSLVFTEEEIEDLADMKGNDSRIFPMLTLLFPELDSKDGSDIDHVFPKSRFTPRRLADAGVEEEKIEEYREHCNRIANFQLLDRTINNEKRATLPAEWLDVHCPDEERRRYYCERHLLGEVPREITCFGKFYSAHREELKKRISQLVNIS